MRLTTRTVSLDRRSTTPTRKNTFSGKRLLIHSGQDKSPLLATSFITTVRSLDVMPIALPVCRIDAGMPLTEGRLEGLERSLERRSVATRRPAAVIHQRHDVDAPVPVLALGVGSPVLRPSRPLRRRMRRGIRQCCCAVREIGHRCLGQRQSGGQAKTLGVINARRLMRAS